MIIQPGNFSDPQVLDLLRVHLAGVHATSPPGCVLALDLSGLRTPYVTVWTASEGEALLGFGALRELTPATGEIKSMRTAKPLEITRGPTSTSFCTSRSGGTHKCLA